MRVGLHLVAVLVYLVTQVLELARFGHWKGVEISFNAGMALAKHTVETNGGSWSILF